MRLTSIVLVILTAISANKPSSAQQRELIPQAIVNLQQTASSKTNFTFDHSMLIFASKLESGDEDLRRVIAGVSGISVHNYHFAEPGQYDPAVLRSVKGEYRAAGWRQLVDREERTGQDVSDLWVRFENNAVTNVAVLLAKANEVNFVVVSGSISPLDISHLGGHFGIPKIEGGVLVPNVAARP
jgi:hypothetical protein